MLWMVSIILYCTFMCVSFFEDLVDWGISLCLFLLLLNAYSKNNIRSINWSHFFIFYLINFKIICADLGKNIINLNIYKLDLKTYQRTVSKDSMRLETSRQYTMIKFIVLTIRFYLFNLVSFCILKLYSVFYIYIYISF